MQNPQAIMQLISFMNNYKGNPKEDAMKAIQNAGLNQQQLNELQNQANALYAMGRQMGFIKK